MLFCFSILAIALLISSSVAVTFCFLASCSSQLLVDQRAQDLGREVLARLRRVGDVGRQHHHAHPRDEIEDRDDLVVDDGGDPRLGLEPAPAAGPGAAAGSPPAGRCARRRSRGRRVRRRREQGGRPGNRDLQDHQRNRPASSAGDPTHCSAPVLILVAGCRLCAEARQGIARLALQPPVPATEATVPPISPMFLNTTLNSTEYAGRHVAVADPGLGERGDERHALVLVNRRQRRIKAGAARLRRDHPVDDVGVASG